MIIPIKLTNYSYDVIILPNLLDEIEKHITFPSQTMVITDSNIPLIYQEKVKAKAKNVIVHSIAPGEKSKSLSVYENIISQLLAIKFSKTDLIIALGGGVVGDLAGFVAATYKRGCRFINIPTTTLSMVDSSIGGKVALNSNNVKNAVGTFYQPEKVLIDLSTLKTLPNRHFKNGLIEALKAGILGDEILFNLFYNDQYLGALEEVVIRAINVKKKIVEQDVYDNNIRQLLNLGHTIGHAIESCNLDKVLHGEAVALGMSYVLGEALKVKTKKILRAMNSDLNFAINWQEIYNFILNDKKVSDQGIKLIKVDKIGQPYFVFVNEEELLNILKGE